MTPDARLHAMYRLLNECGDDAACGCGCAKDAPAKKKGKKLEDLGVVERVLAALEEARRKIGLRQFRRIRKVRELKPARGRKLSNVRKMKRSIRRGAAYNRHR